MFGRLLELGARCLTRACIILLYYIHNICYTLTRPPGVQAVISKVEQPVVQVLDLVAERAVILEVILAGVPLVDRQQSRLAVS